MAKNGKGLVALALIISLIGAGAGGFMLIKTYVLEPRYVLPMARVYRLGSYFLNSGASTTFDYSDKSFDTHDAFDLVSDSYEIPETGFYHVIAQYCIDVEFQDFLKIEIHLNGTTISSRSYTAARSTNTFTVSVNDIINVTAADLISIRAYSYNLAADPREVFSEEPYTFFTIMKIS